MESQDAVVSRTDALRLIPRLEINMGRALFRRRHLNREIVIGFIGLRGEMKSLTSSIVALNDFMLDNLPCWSNMQIAYKFGISDDVAAKYGLKHGGDVAFQSQELDRTALFNLDEKYRDGLLFIDEINMQFAEARRAMSGTNLESAAVIQQLRKLRCSLIYTVIHEMWIDPRIRDGTDIFVKCEDTALSPEGLWQQRPLGVTCQWTIYPMTRILTGWTYARAHKTLGPAYVTAKPYWGIMDTYQLQHRSSYSVKMQNGHAVDVTMIPNAAQIEMKSKWGWLYDAVQALHDAGTTFMEASELWRYLQLDERGLNPKTVGPQLSAMGISKYQGAGGRYFYTIDDFDLAKLPADQKEAVLAHS